MNRENFNFGRRFIPTIKRALGACIFEEASAELDMKEATDLILLKAKDMRVACRIRRPGYWDKYPWQFTIRSSVPSGAETELHKIIKGWGDWLFYGHADDNNSISISKYFIIDLAHFRAHLLQQTDCCLGWDIVNGDGTAFAAWHIPNFAPTPPLCVRTWTPIPAASIDPKSRATYSQRFRRSDPAEQEFEEIPF